MNTSELFDKAAAETERLQRELDITNADHIALWLETNKDDSSLGWLACRIIEAHEQSLSTLRQRIEALEAENGRLREALKPFAKMGELANFAFAPALFHDRDQIKGLPWKNDGEIVTITFGDCRRAHQALGEG